MSDSSRREIPERGLEVDLIVGRRTDTVDGISRYTGEVLRLNRDKADFKIIGFDAGRSPMAGKLKGVFRYPFTVRRERREGSVKHVASLVEAPLLNYLDLSPSAVTCYDIYPLLPSAYAVPERSYLRFAARGMLKADRIITISEFSRSEIAGRLGYPESRIRVIYPGVDHSRYRPLPKSEELDQRYRLNPGCKVVLYVGMEQPRKNLTVLVKALDGLRRQGMDVMLLKVGKPHRRAERSKLVSTIDELGLRDYVAILDYVEESELPRIYNLADLFVFPSLYEGFGLPPLEAMACGCPVIVSDTPALTEVVGEAGVAVDPRDVGGLAGSMQRVLSDEAFSGELARKGLERARKFDWEKAAAETMGVYHELGAVL